ncbi:hypothetical protein PSTG_18860 [Puccinia striiformis f. sp. tritici PST-78]|uniref:Uncharacterized protein n=1 Tax=Puccinia striiformis f. sp. tritici PST-78 TaxID=1165861 RepID=A0A0L0ULV0_9BASI|nr:hypothetical protein PSTG_18860 [Puccinia striiformis f. sp. tritici PST-78]
MQSSVIVLLKLLLATVTANTNTNNSNEAEQPHDRRNRHPQTSRDHFPGSFGYLDLTTEMTS